MNRRQLIRYAAALPVVMCSPSLLAAIDRLEKDKSIWRSLLKRDAYLVLFEEATEPPNSSPLNDEKRDGTFVCAACFLPLFTSEHKYDSGTGWPSFTQPIKGSIGTKTDYPRPRNERWCNNGLALKFYPEVEPLPALRS
jgi:peptide-methionine (R)-S-oxide reductase